MAFTGVHVLCAQAGGDSGEGRPLQPLLVNPAWSETMSVAGTTTQKAPPLRDLPNVFHIQVSADSWVAIGKSPDASKAIGSGAQSRFLVRAGAGNDVDVYVKPGDKLAWILAV